MTRFGAAKVASIPLFLVVLGVFIGGTIWTIVFSFTGSHRLPVDERMESLESSMSACCSGRRAGRSRSATSPSTACSRSPSRSPSLTFLAVSWTTEICFYIGAFRTIYLYPFALSFIS